MERCFRAEADKLAGVRMDRSWLYKEPPISSTCLNGSGKWRWKVEGVQNLRQGEQAHKGRPATPWMGPQRTAAGT